MPEDDIELSPGAPDYVQAWLLNSCDTFYNIRINSIYEIIRERIVDAVIDYIDDGDKDSYLDEINVVDLGAGLGQLTKMLARFLMLRYPNIKLSILGCDFSQLTIENAEDEFKSELDCDELKERVTFRRVDVSADLSWLKHFSDNPYSINIITASGFLTRNVVSDDQKKYLLANILMDQRVDVIFASGYMPPALSSDEVQCLGYQYEKHNIIHVYKPNTIGTLVSQVTQYENLIEILYFSYKSTFSFEDDPLKPLCSGSLTLEAGNGEEVEKLIRQFEYIRCLHEKFIDQLCDPFELLFLATLYHYGCYYKKLNYTPYSPLESLGSYPVDPRNEVACYSRMRECGFLAKPLALRLIAEANQSDERIDIRKA